MKKSEFIKQLEAIEGDPEVAILDYLTNANEEKEGSVEGIYKDFQIEVIEDQASNQEAWIAISFENTHVSTSEEAEKADKWDQLKELLLS